MHMQRIRLIRSDFISFFFLFYLCTSKFSVYSKQRKLSRPFLFSDSLTLFEFAIVLNRSVLNSQKIKCYFFHFHQRTSHEFGVTEPTSDQSSMRNVNACEWHSHSLCVYTSHWCLTNQTASESLKSEKLTQYCADEIILCRNFISLIDYDGIGTLQFFIDHIQV